MNSVIDQIKVRIMYSSVKALFVKNEVGNYAWIPKSIIHNSYNENDNELFQVLQVEKWFLDKNKQIYEWGWKMNREDITKKGNIKGNKYELKLSGKKVEEKAFQIINAIRKGIEDEEKWIKTRLRRKFKKTLREIGLEVK